MWNSSIKLPVKVEIQENENGYEDAEIVIFLEGIPANFKDATDNQKVIANQSGYLADTVIEIAQCNYNGESYLINEADEIRYDIKQSFKKDKSMNIFLTCERRK